MTDVPWPNRCLFTYGQAVQRRNLSSGKSPAYRFPGIIVGWYLNPNAVDGEGRGYAVASAREPGCVQIFAETQLEPLSDEAKP